MWEGTQQQAWARLLAELGLPAAPQVGEHIAANAPDAPPLAGTVVQASSWRLALLLDDPAPGTAFLAVEGTGDQVGVSIWSYVYGDDRDAIAERDEPRWRDWLARPHVRRLRSPLLRPAPSVRCPRGQPASVEIPVVDIGSDDAPAAIDRACRTTGFFALTGHGIPTSMRTDLLAAAREFFALPTERKELVGLARGGTAWRGWFPLGDELTSGVPDLKEGFYVGRDLPPDPLPLHGPNLWPDDVAGAARRGRRLDGGDGGARPTSARGDGGRSRPRRRLVPCRHHRRSHRAVPDLPLPAAPGRGRPIAGASASTPTTGCSPCSPTTAPPGSR